MPPPGQATRSLQSPKAGPEPGSTPGHRRRAARRSARASGRPFLLRLRAELAQWAGEPWGGQGQVAAERNPLAAGVLEARGQGDRSEPPASGGRHCQTPSLAKGYLCNASGLRILSVGTGRSLGASMGRILGDGLGNVGAVVSPPQMGALL